MELLGHNHNINNNDLSLFIKKLVFGKKEIGSTEKWLGDISMHDIYWNNIADKLSKVEQCEKIIKTKDSNEDMILFISENTSTKYVKNIISIYDSVISPSDKYFDILVLNNEEYKAWENNESNVIYWENTNERV